MTRITKKEHRQVTHVLRQALETATRQVGKELTFSGERAARQYVQDLEILLEKLETADFLVLGQAQTMHTEDEYL